MKGWIRNIFLCSPSPNFKTSCLTPGGRVYSQTSYQLENLKSELDIIGMYVLMSEIDKEWHGSQPHPVFSGAKNTVRVKWLPVPLWDMSVLKGMDAPLPSIPPSSIHQLSPFHLFCLNPSLQVLVLFSIPRLTSEQLSIPYGNTCHHCYLSALLEPGSPSLAIRARYFQSPCWDNQRVYSTTETEVSVTK